MGLDFNFLTALTGSAAKTAATGVITNKSTSTGNTSVFSDLLQASLQGNQMITPVETGKASNGNSAKAPTGQFAPATPLQPINTQKVDNNAALSGQGDTPDAQSELAIEGLVSVQGQVQITPQSSIQLDQLTPDGIPVIRTGPGFGATGNEKSLPPNLSGLPVENLGKVIAEQTPTITPQPVGAPGIQTGEVIAALDPKNISVPHPARAPGFQTGPVVRTVDSKTTGILQPSGSPGFQSGEVAAALDPKNISVPHPARAPGFQTGPVETATNQKTALSQLISGFTQSAMAVKLGEGQAIRLKGHGKATVKGTPTPGGSSPTASSQVTQTGASSQPGKAGAVVGAPPLPSTKSRSAPTLASHGVNEVFQDKASITLAPFGANVLAIGDEEQEIRSNNDLALSGKTAQGHNGLATKAASLSSSNAPRLNAAALASFATSVAQRAQGGSTRFEIRLDPAALGRVQVKLEVSADNRVEAMVSTHRPDVLADLQRGADSLRRALSDLGFDVSSDGLAFSLEHENDGFAAGEDTGRQHFTDEPVEPEIQPLTNAPLLASSEYKYGLTRILTDRVDVKI